MTNPEMNSQHPLSYHNRTNHILPERKNVMQQEFYKLKEFANLHEMVINGDKTKAMLFNSARKCDCMPQVDNGSGEYLEVSEEHELLGVIVSSDMTWHSNTEYMGMLRNLKRLGADTEELSRCILQTM